MSAPSWAETRVRVHPESAVQQGGLNPPLMKPSPSFFRKGVASSSRKGQLKGRPMQSTAIDPLLQPSLITRRTIHQGMTLEDGKILCVPTAKGLAITRTSATSSTGDLPTLPKPIWYKIHNKGERLPKQLKHSRA